jgi:hypothetical protein
LNVLDPAVVAHFDEYSRKVRELTCFYLPKEDIRLHTQLAGLRPTGAALCPSLKVLRWFTSDGRHNTIAHFFITPSLQRVHILLSESVQPGALLRDSLCRFLDAVASAVPSLQHLDIRGPIVDSTLAQFKRIQSLRLYGNTVCHSILLLFSNSFKNLVRLEIEAQSIQMGDLPVTTFPCLEELHIAGYAIFMESVLQRMTAAHLRVFSFSTDYWQQSDVLGVLKVVSTRFGETLRSVSVVMDAGGVSSNGRPPPNLTDLANQNNTEITLKPLLQIQDLEDFSFRFVPRQVFLCDSISQMASAWRNLKSLSITGTCPLLSLHCFIDLANLCPRLAELCIDLRAVIPPALNFLAPSKHNLHTLWIRNFGLPWAGHYLDVLKYVDHLFPNLRSGSIYEYDSRLDKWVMVYSLTQPYHPAKHWSESSKDTLAACSGLDVNAFTRQTNRTRSYPAVSVP